jgi:Tol biopolymer transport system component
MGAVITRLALTGAFVGGALLTGLSACSAFDALDQEGLSISVAPADTAVTLGGQVIIRGLMVNKFGDRYPTDQIEYQALDPAASVSGTGTVTGLAYGRARIVASRGDLADTGRVSVVPPGTLALSSISDQSAVSLASTDGSGLRRIVGSGQVSGGAAAWLPGDAGIVYQYAIPGGAGGTRLYVSDLAGNGMRLVSDPEGERDEKQPRVSRDGAWVYFRYGVGGGEIWRIHPDGSGLERVTGPAPAYEGDAGPDPSPDGKSLAFAGDRSTPEVFELVVHDLETGDERPLGVRGLLPRWAPDGGRIAYWAGANPWQDGAIFVVGADGTGAHQVSEPGRRYFPEGLDWSPDGNWLVARSDARLDLIEVATGLTLPLGYSEAYWLTSWRW